MISWSVENKVEGALLISKPLRLGSAEDPTNVYTVGIKSSPTENTFYDKMCT